MLQIDTEGTVPLPAAAGVGTTCGCGAPKLLRPTPPSAWTSPAGCSARNSTGKPPSPTNSYMRLRSPTSSPGSPTSYATPRRCPPAAPSKRTPAMFTSVPGPAPSPAGSPTVTSRGCPTTGSPSPCGAARSTAARQPARLRTRSTPLNYSYALAEAECRLAVLAVGLDPGLGVAWWPRQRAPRGRKGVAAARHVRSCALCPSPGWGWPNGSESGERGGPRR
jgi:hypothetical protein